MISLGIGVMVPRLLMGDLLFFLPVLHAKRVTELLLYLWESCDLSTDFPL